MANTIHEHKLEDELKRLLEELRVAVPGVQILLAFLLSVPFNQRFTELDHIGLVLYGWALGAAFAASVLLIAPTVYHRLHFRWEVKDRGTMLWVFNRLALAGMTCLAVGLTAGVTFIAHFVFGQAAAILVALLRSGSCAALWYGPPIVRRGLRGQRRDHVELHQASADR